jgi:hypothetical protein
MEGEQEVIMEEKKCLSTVRRLRTYLGVFYLVMLWGVYAHIMVEVNIQRHFKVPIHSFFRDIWPGIGPFAKLYIVLVLYITLHMAVVAGWALLRRRHGRTAS